MTHDSDGKLVEMGHFHHGISVPTHGSLNLEVQPHVWLSITTSEWISLRLSKTPQTWMHIHDQHAKGEFQPSQPILVWRFEDAPEEFQSLSEHGGDEDWLAFVPDKQPMPFWMDSGTLFGICETSEHPIETGTVYIGAHA